MKEATEKLEKAAREALRHLVIERIVEKASAELGAYGLDVAADRPGFVTDRDAVIEVLKAALGALAPRASQDTEKSTGREVTIYPHPETGEPTSGVPDFLGDGDAPAEQTKTCRRCGVEKPLDAFAPKLHTCKECKSEMGREAAKKRAENRAEKERKRKLAEQRERERASREAEREPVVRHAKSGDPSKAKVTLHPREPRAVEPERVSAPSNPKNGAEARLCANGPGCAHFVRLGHPAKLAGGNGNAVCFACERRASDPVPLTAGIRA